ncbi:MAG: hypothetical protein SGI83_13015 [Bacteroidota bacterium]|nr:hypothetical protein [Bacteroidota bacterium]
MYKKILLLIVMTGFISVLQAQKSSKSSKTTTGYAITAAEKGGKSWREVRLVNVSTGTVIKIIYDSKQETEALNATTGKPVVKKDLTNSKSTTTIATFTTTPSQNIAQRKVVNLDQELDKANGHPTRTYTRTSQGTVAGPLWQTDHYQRSKRQQRSTDRRDQIPRAVC